MEKLGDMRNAKFISFHLFHKNKIHYVEEKTFDFLTFLFFRKTLSRNIF